MKDMINKLKDLRNVAQTLKSLDRENPDPQVIQKTLERALKSHRKPQIVFDQVKHT